MYNHWVADQNNKEASSQSLIARLINFRRQIRFSAFVLASLSVIFTASLPAAKGGQFYTLEFVALSGEGIDGSTLPFTGIISQTVSINDQGFVAFGDSFSDPFLGQGVMFGDGVTPPTLVSGEAFIGGSRIFSQSMQLNNLNEIVARDRVSGSPTVQSGTFAARFDVLRSGENDAVAKIHPM